MTRYFFHVVNDTFRTDDEIGMEFPHLAAALCHARIALGQILADEITAETAVIHLAVMIDDDQGDQVANLKTVTTTVINAVRQQAEPPKG